MPTRDLKQCKLWDTIVNGSFGSIDEEELLRQIYDAFTPEIGRLKEAEVVEHGNKDVPNGARSTKTPSQILFEKDYDEVNRTMLSLQLLRWLLNGDMDSFTRGQLESIKLSESSFNSLKQYFEEHLPASIDILSLVIAIVVNDLGKDKNLRNEYFEKTNESLDGANHDVVLFEAAKAGLVPCLDTLDDSERADVMLGLELGSTLNLAQLAQAENVPVNLEGLLNMEGHERAFHMKFMEQILDVAGAAGHTFPGGSKTFTEPVFKAYMIGLQVSLCIISGNCSLQEGYNLVLEQKAKLLCDQGFRTLTVTDPTERAELRLLAMGRVADAERAALFENAFNSLDEGARVALVKGLNIDAVQENETAVIPYYGPAMIAQALTTTEGTGKQQEALAAVLRYLSRALNWTSEDDRIASLTPLSESKASIWPPPPEFVAPTSESRVFERDMREAMRTIKTEDFKQDPRQLDNLMMSPGYPVQRRRASQSPVDPSTKALMRPRSNPFLTDQPYQAFRERRLG